MRRTRARPKTPFHMTIALTYMKSCSIHLLPEGFCFSIPVGKGVGVCGGGGGGRFLGKQIHYLVSRPLKGGKQIQAEIQQAGLFTS